MTIADYTFNLVIKAILNFDFLLSLGLKMEYERTEDAQIQADFANRVGQILLQYERLKLALPDDQQFEVTLTIALLQSMLTQCWELLKRLHIPSMAPDGLEDLVTMANRGFDDPPPLLGLTEACIQERWPTTQVLKYRDLIECIRNALSHPSPQHSEGLPRTGFMTLQGDSGLIESIVFTQSPWVDFDGQLERKYQARQGKYEGIVRAKKAVNGWTAAHGTTGVELLEQAGGKLLPMRAGQLFLPIMRIKLDAAHLRVFVLALSDYLSEPLRQGVSKKASRALS